MILAGGKSSRLGTDKASLFLDRVVRAIEPHVAEILVAVDSPDRPVPTGTCAVVDLFPKKGPLSGIYSGLKGAKHDRCLLAACDMPFIQPALVRLLIGLSGDGDALVPRIDDRPQPLLAVYRKSCVPALQQALAQEDLKVERFLERIHVRYVTGEDLRSADPDLISFFNVNRPEDLDQAKQLGL